MKKRTLASLTFVLLSVTLYAQINKRTIMIGATSNLSFTHSSGDDINTNDFLQVGLKGGYFLADNFVVGGHVDYVDYDFTGNHQWVYGAFARYYIKGKWFLGTGLSTSEYKDSESQKARTYSVPLEAGYAFFVNDFMAIEPTLNYTLHRGDTNFNQLGVKVGLQFYLNRKKN